MKHDHEYFTRVAAECIEKNMLYWSDINPYTTPRLRKLWADGYAGLPFNDSLNAVGSYNWRAWNLGVYAKRVAAAFPPALPGQLYGNQN